MPACKIFLYIRDVKMDVRGSVRSSNCLREPVIHSCCPLIHAQIDNDEKGHASELSDND